MNKKEKLQLAFDILMARKYKKQIILANLAGVAVIMCYYAIQDYREQREFDRTMAPYRQENQ